jgi:hypothetical protein
MDSETVARGEHKPDLANLQNQLAIFPFAPHGRYTAHCPSERHE